MKKALGLAVLMLFAVSTAQAQVGNVAATDHNMTAVAGLTNGNPITTTDNQVCVYCHAPHDNVSTTGLLWNKAVPAPGSFDPYVNTATMDSDPSGGPGPESLLCLSCHDGVTAVDEALGGTVLLVAADAGYIGTDLKNDHPVGIQYATAHADVTSGALYDPATTASGVGTGNIDTDMLRGAANDQVECSSCHDPHTTLQANFLVKANTASALCTTCHAK